MPSTTCGVHTDDIIGVTIDVGRARGQQPTSRCGFVAGVLGLQAESLPLSTKQAARPAHGNVHPHAKALTERRGFHACGRYPP